MFLLSNISGCVPHLFLTRGIACSSTCQNNHYITLGLTPTATQDEIKKAYFELCKKYHPDKNDGSNEGTTMFRKVTEAYEILGNEKSRQLYDQKMFYAGPTARRPTVNRREDYNYEAERYFYERTNPRRRYTGKTQHFDFDAWTQAHYPKSKHEEYNMGRSQGRNWRTVRRGVSGVSRSLIAINIIGFILVTFMMTSLPAFYSPQNYGISIDLTEKLSNESESDSDESDKDKP